MVDPILIIAIATAAFGACSLVLSLSRSHWR
jgi:hypothetical protein